MPSELIEIQRSKTSVDQDWMTEILSFEEQNHSFQVERFELAWVPRSKPLIRILAQLISSDMRAVRYIDYVFSTDEDKRTSLDRFLKVLESPSISKKSLRSEAHPKVFEGKI